jgi:hypothetical protein
VLLPAGVYPRRGGDGGPAPVEEAGNHGPDGTPDPTPPRLAREEGDVVSVPRPGHPRAQVLGHPVPDESEGNCLVGEGVGSRVGTPALRESEDGGEAPTHALGACALAAAVRRRRIEVGGPPWATAAGLADLAKRAYLPALRSPSLRRREEAGVVRVPVNLTLTAHSTSTRATLSTARASSGGRVRRMLSLAPKTV